MLRNPKGATSLRWLRVLLDGGIEVHGQIVVCPGVNDGPALEDTLAGILDRYPELASVGAVPLGLSRFSQRAWLRPHTAREAAQVLDTLGEWQALYRRALGRRMVFAGDEYYLMAGREVPSAREYEGYPQHENGIGMARAFAESFRDPARGGPGGVRHGFFASVDAAPAEGYRALRLLGRAAAGADGRPVTILTGTYGARVLGAAGGRAPEARRGGAGRAQRLLRRQHRRGRSAHRRGRGRRPEGGAGGAPLRWCRTPASTRAAFWTG